MTERALERAPDASPQPGRAGPARGMARGASPAAGHELFAVAGRRARAMQTKIEVGPSDDPHEREADRVAERVMRTPEPGSRPRRASPGGGAAPPIVHEALHSPGAPLNPTSRAFFEPRLGADLSSVRVHRGATAAASARAVNAAAYTVGQDIVFAEGRYAPETNDGKHLLAHELTHVIQQHAMTGPAPPVLARATETTEAPSKTPLATVAAGTPLLQRQDLSTPIVNTDTPAPRVNPTPALDSLEVLRVKAQRLINGTSAWQTNNWIDFLSSTSSNPRLTFGDSELAGQAANVLGNVLTELGSDLIKTAGDKSVAALGALIGTAIEPGMGTFIGFLLGVLIESAAAWIFEQVTGKTEQDETAAETGQRVRLLIAEQHMLLAAAEVKTLAQLDDILEYARLHAKQADTQADVNNYASTVTRAAEMIPAQPRIDDNSLSEYLLKIWVFEHAGNVGKVHAGTNPVEWQNALGRVFDGATYVENQPALFAFQTRAEWEKAGLDHTALTAKMMSDALAIAAAAGKDPELAVQGAFHDEIYDLTVKDPEAFVRYVNDHVSRPGNHPAAPSGPSYADQWYEEGIFETVMEGVVWASCTLDVAVSRGSAYIDEWNWAVAWSPSPDHLLQRKLEFDVWPTWS